MPNLKTEIPKGCGTRWNQYLPLYSTCQRFGKVKNLILYCKNKTECFLWKARHNWQKNIAKLWTEEKIWKTTKIVKILKNRQIGQISGIAKHSEFEKKSLKVGKIAKSQLLPNIEKIRQITNIAKPEKNSPNHKSWQTWKKFVKSHKLPNIKNSANFKSR